MADKADGYRAVMCCGSCGHGAWCECCQGGCRECWWAVGLILDNDITAEQIADVEFEVDFAMAGPPRFRGGRP